MSGIAGYVVVRTRSGPASDRGDAEARTDLAVLEGAGQYVAARERVRRLNAGNTVPGLQFRVGVVYGDGCRMPW
jgi:hypothetical protein